MSFLSKKIVLCEGVRIPIGHLYKSLAKFPPEDLLKIVLEKLLTKASLDPKEVDGMIIGWVGQGSHAPNVARIGLLNAGIPEDVYAMTIQCNCVSGIESVSSSARRIITGEGELFIAGGTESMSTFPYTIRGSRSSKPLRSMDALKSNWSNLLDEPDISVVDCMAEGLTDPVKHINMAQTAEVCAQKFSISRAEQDAYTNETFSRCSKGIESGFYAGHVIPITDNGTEILKNDEHPVLRRNMVGKIEKFAKAPVLFQRKDYPFSQFYKDFAEYLGETKYEEGKSKASVTLFNSCARSDGAACIIVTTEEKAKSLGLEILAEIKSWGYVGNNPALMGISPAYATEDCLNRVGVNFNDINNIELHEAFAATVLSTFKLGKEKFGHNWLDKWEKGQVNPNGGSIPLGHPLAATGTRLLLNLLYSMKNDDKARYGLAAACASGGIGGAMLIEKRN